MKTVILIIGKMRSGKDTSGDSIREYLSVRGIPSRKLAFAAPLKEQVTQDFSELFEFLRAQRYLLMSRGVPESDLEWMRVSHDSLWGEKTGFTRPLLQAYGTEIFRNRVSKTYWTDKLFTEVDSMEDNSVCIVTDARYRNEVEEADEWMMRDPSNRRVIAFKVVRTSLSGPQATSSHTSETSLDGFRGTVIHNDGSLLELKERIHEYLRKVFHIE